MQSARGWKPSSERGTKFTGYQVSALRCAQGKHRQASQHICCGEHKSRSLTAGAKHHGKAVQLIQPWICAFPRLNIRVALPIVLRLCSCIGSEERGILDG